MNYRTELSTAILTSPTAQKIIDYVSPIYGESYVGLWLFQVIGLALDDVVDIVVALREETNPITSTLLLDQWEDHYGLARDRSLTTEQRQARLLAKLLSRGPCNPARLAAAVSSAIGGAPVKILENVAKNTFRVIILQVIPSLDPVKAVLERRKPAHLIYEIQVVQQTRADTNINIGVAVTRAESYHVEVQQ